MCGLHISSPASSSSSSSSSSPVAARPSTTPSVLTTRAVLWSHQMEALAAGTHARCGAQSPARRLTPSLLAAVCHALWDPSSSSPSPTATLLSFNNGANGGDVVVNVALGVRVKPAVSGGGGTDSAKPRDGHAVVVPSDVVCASVCVPRTGAIRVKKLDHKKALTLQQDPAPAADPQGDSPQQSGGGDSESETPCYGWKLIGPHGDCVAKRHNSYRTYLGSWYLIPSDGDRCVPQGGANNTADGPRCLLEESYRPVFNRFQAGTSKWWACCDTRELSFVDLCNKGRSYGHNVDYGPFVFQLNTSEVNPNELVVAVPYSLTCTQFLLYDVDRSLQTENLTIYMSEIMCMKNSGNRVFIVQYRDPADKTLEQSVIFNVEEETGFSKVVTDSVLKLCHLTQSLFCTLHRSTTPHQGMCCRIWDCNDTSNPLRVIQDAVEGCVSIDATCGLLFVCTSNNQIKVVDALSGVALATLEVPSSFSLELTQVVGSASLHQSNSC
ncbi:hypothetical protein Pelo_6963 [Pelomyxa schiedti]|nr:hypothetical protein Pelo_6963 [Pelomyxa schiedti]